MENSMVKTPKNQASRNSKPRKVIKVVTDEDIRRRAFEIYEEQDGSTHNDLDDWLRAERELRGFNQ